MQCKSQSAATTFLSASVLLDVHMYPLLVEQTCFCLTDKATAWLRTGKSLLPCLILFQSEQFSSLAASFTNPRQVPLSRAMSRQSGSRPHLFRFLRTKSFHRLFWPPADHLPPCGLHTRRHLGRSVVHLLRVAQTHTHTHTLFCVCKVFA